MASSTLGIQVEDYDSLASVNLNLPHCVPDEEDIERSTSRRRDGHVRSKRTKGGSTLAVPGLRAKHVDDRNDSVLSSHSRAMLSEDRPRSVLSVLKTRMMERPLTAISRALSARKRRLVENLPSMATVSTNVKNRILELVRRRRGVGRSSSLSTSSSESDIRTISARSGSIKKKLDSLAGSEYDYSDSEFSNDGEASAKRRWQVPYPRAVMKPIKRLRKKFKQFECRCTCNYIVDPHGDVFLVWMGIMFAAFLYNAVTIPLRASFNVYCHVPAMAAFLAVDYACDALYVLDMILVQSHLSFRQNGVLERELRRLVKRYTTHWPFWVDLLSLLPLDLLYAIPSLHFNALLRLPRLLRLHIAYVFLHQYESSTRFPYLFRLLKLSGYLLFFIHLYTCVYYAVSLKAGIGSNEWVYDGEGNSYLHCFYWATLSVATIHDLEERNPTNNLEYTVEMVGYLLGVFIIAVIINEIKGIVEAASKHKLSFRRKHDRLKQYMHMWKVPKALQERVHAWYEFASTQQQTLDEGQVLETLSKKMRADLAIHVHLDTLHRVKIFQDCEKTLLRELVLKLRPILFVPSDYICKKGEIGKEMYIVNQGIVQVVGGSEGNQILADLGPGSVFGEISLLAVGGGNRRTAHVISKGFSSLFVLSKKDLHETLAYYPDAQETLKKKARYLLRQDRKRERFSKARMGGTASEKMPSSIRHSKVAQAAVAAFTTAAARAAQTRRNNRVAPEQERENNECSTLRITVPQVEVHMAAVHHDSADGKGERRGARATPQEQAATRMRKATLGLTLDQSQITMASQATTLSVQSTNALTPESSGNWFNLSVDSSCASLWPSVKKLRTSNQPEPDKDESVVSEASSTTQAYKSLWLSARNVNLRAASLTANGGSVPSSQDLVPEEAELPSTVQHYRSLWPSMKKVKSVTSNTLETPLGGLTPSDTQSLSASGSSSYASFWPKRKVLLEVGGSSGGQGKGGGAGSEVSLQSGSVLSDMDFLSEDSSAC